MPHARPPPSGSPLVADEDLPGAPSPERARQELAQIESKVMQSQTVQVDEIEELKKKLALEMEARDDAERRAVEATVLLSLAHHTHCSV